MGRTKLICLWNLIFIFHSKMFALIYATPTTDITTEESKCVYKDLLELSQRIAILETKQNLYTEDRQRLNRLETTYTTERQQMFGYFGNITETIKRQMEIKNEYYTLNSTLEDLKNEQRKRMQNMQELRNQQEEMKNNLVEMRIEQQEIKQHIEEMGREYQEIKQTNAEMRREQQKIKQNMEEMTHTLRELKQEIAILSEQNKENYDNLSVDINELKHNMEVQIAKITETQNKNKTLSDIVQTVKYGVGTEHIINQQSNKFSSTMRETQNNVRNESSYKQQINETDTYQVTELSDVNSKFLILNQSLKEMQHSIINVETVLSHLQSHCTGFSEGLVGFSAVLSKNIDNMAAGYVVKFDRVTINEGKDYDPNSGKFTCQRPGVYMFTWNIMAPRGFNTEVNLKVNGVKLRRSKAFTNFDIYANGANSVIVRLQAGDHVWIENLYQQTSLHELHTTFSGYLISNTGFSYGLIAFSAVMSKNIDNMAAGYVVKFDRVTINEGKGYDPNSGKFTCARPGVYMFTWNIMAPKGFNTEVNLKVNGAKLRRSKAFTNFDVYANGANSVIVRLQAGDHVWIENLYQRTSIHELHTTFSGYLISE